MVELEKKGISTLARLEDVEFISKPIPYEFSGSFDPDIIQTPYQITEYYSISNLSTAYSTEVIIEDSTAYSYVPRRPEFVETLKDFQYIYPEMFSVQVQEEIVSPFHPQSYNITDIVIFDNNYQIINPPTIDEIIKNPNRNDFIVFSDDNLEQGFSLVDKVFQYNFYWSMQTGKEGNEIWLEVRRLNEPSSKIHGELYYHMIFNDDMTICTHTDSHFFNYDEDSYQKRLEGKVKVPLLKMDDGNRVVNSKFYHFSANVNLENPFLTGDAILLGKSFFNDPRIDRYLINILDQTRG